MSATTAETPQVLLEHHLKALRLPTMLRESLRDIEACLEANQAKLFLVLPVDY